MGYSRRRRIKKRVKIIKTLYSQEENKAEKALKVGGKMATVEFYLLILRIYLFRLTVFLSLKCWREVETEAIEARLISPYYVD